MGRPVNDLSNQIFGRLTVVRRETDVYDRHGVKWICRCSCGQQISVYGHHLSQGRTVSCGCKKSEYATTQISNINKTHGMYGTPEYVSWQAMKTRCENENHEWFHRYGGRGISVCERWNSFENFYADMGPKPTPDHSIERENNDLGYGPDNCRWATEKEQMNNRSNNVYFQYQGVRITKTQLAEKLGVSVDVLDTRLKHSPTLNGLIKPDL